jgi:threonine aldolase
MELSDQKIDFTCDYNTSAHPLVLEALSESVRTKFPGYGQDDESEDARQIIRDLTGLNGAFIRFLAGGTQANMVALAAMLKPCDAVIAAASGHINTHETGAVEATGHKILTAASTDGKLRPGQILDIYAAHDFGRNMHMVRPGAVYISQATEFGTVYTLDELRAIRRQCDQLELFLYIDGARLGYGLAAMDGSPSLRDYADAARPDAFTIGGTKQGLLFGEALVVPNYELTRGLDPFIKQRGALLAKGFLSGIQFKTILEGGMDSLYFRLSAAADRMADKLRRGLRAKGYRFEVDSQANQLFPILPENLARKLEPDFGFEYWDRIDEENLSIRLTATWQTTDEEVEAFLSALPVLSS